MLGPTARPSVPGWGPRACISLHRVRRSLSHNLAPVPPPSSSPGTSASDQTSRRLASLCSLNVPSSFQRRGFCSSCAWKSLLPRGNCCISSRAAPLWGLPWPPRPFPRDAVAKTADCAGSRGPRLPHSSGSWKSQPRRRRACVLSAGSAGAPAPRLSLSSCWAPSHRHPISRRDHIQRSWGWDFSMFFIKNTIQL